MSEPEVQQLRRPSAGMEPEDALQMQARQDLGRHYVASIMAAAFDDSDYGF